MHMDIKYELTQNPERVIDDSYANAKWTTNVNIEIREQKKKQQQQKTTQFHMIFIT